jgi:LPS export ABC transporter protein LptC
MINPNSQKIKYLSAISLLIILAVTGCDKKIETIPKTDFLVLPSYTARNFQTTLTDSGLVQLVMYSPLLEKYDNRDFPYTEFTQGIKVVFYEGKKDPIASVVSKYAKYTQTNNVWELKDSVVVINENNEKLETELLYWNQQSDKIYTDRFVKVTSGNDVILGYGLESDSHLRNRVIKKIRAEFYITDEE